MKNNSNEEQLRQRTSQWSMLQDPEKADNLLDPIVIRRALATSATIHPKKEAMRESSTKKWTSHENRTKWSDSGENLK
ncbi:hypothetical protein NECAME_14199 [Necator americanus]|uniref:Uncharacterized protein n=1 Tax=Necator americanus TaxID=51031 RepID=W2SRY8_NECAM|nr:hypothetical protein NECAME_14199 [Necator americanus]ETN71472.1 hypothetical protein NECAME_14199 [Necator americanus]